VRRRDFLVGSGAAALAAGRGISAGASQQNGRPGLLLEAEELFGVSHPDQLLVFRWPGLDPAQTRVTKEGIEVPYQVVEEGTGVLVRATNGIRPNSKNIWRVEAGTPSLAREMRFTDVGGMLIIDNGTVAVRIAKAVSKFGRPRLDGDGQLLAGSLPPIPAPLQGVRHKDGTWTGLGPNILRLQNTYFENWTLGEPNFPATSMTTTILEDGPLRVVVRVQYGAIRPKYSYNIDHYPAGTGYYNCTITLEAGQNSIMVEDDTDMQICYRLDMNAGVNANRARYRGQGADSILNGRGSNGGVYRAIHERFPDEDAEVDLDFSGPKKVGPAASRDTRPPLYSWWSWQMNTGFYWHAFNQLGGNCWGVFQGPASRLSTGGSEVLIGMYTDPASHAHGIEVRHNFRSGTGRVHLTRRAGYGIFLGTKESDVPLSLAASPGVLTAFNLHSGTAQFRKLTKLGLDFPDPPNGWDGLYLEYSAMDALFTAIRNDPGNQHGNGPYARIWQREPNWRQLWDAVHDRSNALAKKMADNILVSIARIVDVYVNKGSIFTPQWIYWVGATEMQALAVTANALLVLDRMSPFLTVINRRKLKLVFSVCAAICWDEDFVPLNGTLGTFHYGTANMPVQMSGYRYFFAAIVKDHPQFESRFAAEVIPKVKELFTRVINVAGAPISGTHYAATVIVPPVDLFRQLQMQKILDVFAPESDIYERLTATCEFLMQIITPSQRRFGMRRKIVPFGDAASEGIDYYGTLIAGFHRSNPTIARRMLGAWHAQGRPVVGRYGCTTLKIDERVPPQDPALGDADFPGYMTVIRSGWNSTHESAVFVDHGIWCQDHEYDKKGSPSIYLLGAPISIQFGSMYSPHLSGGYEMNLYIPERQLLDAHPTKGGRQVEWNSAPPIDNGGTYQGVHTVPGGVGDVSIADSYTFTASEARAEVDCTFLVLGTWRRRLTLYRDVVARPIVRLRDSNADTGKSIFSLNMMAKGAVLMPDGTHYVPRGRNGKIFELGNGQCLRFSGQWGVSWDVYYFGPPAETAISEWSHTWAPAAEVVQYQTATRGATGFNESQYFLRVRTDGPCDVIVLPYFTGQRPPDLQVTQTGSHLVVTADGTSRTLS
jgi:hypothetical protein